MLFVRFVVQNLRIFETGMDHKSPAALSVYILRTGFVVEPMKRSGEPRGSRRTRGINAGSRSL
ncbi:MAG: hypothetical protein DWI02_05255 [Planctomycetota bacterium]|nr:MAG: hypothetical protein DWI02_05255 [Planctomycetota bacterium]